MKRLSCGVAREAVSALADNETPPVSHHLLTQHLELCPACRKFEGAVLDLRRTAGVELVDERPSLAPGVMGRIGELAGWTGPAQAGAQWSHQPQVRLARSQRFQRAALAWHRLSASRASQWAAAVVPLGVAVPALALGLLGHAHIDPSHVLAPCTRALEHRVHALGRAR